MKKGKSITNPQYLKKSVVMAYLSGTGKSQTQLEDELGWGHGSLSKYLTYKTLIPPERLYQLAKAIGFGSTASYLVQYNPTTAMEKAHKEAVQEEKETLEEYAFGLKDALDKAGVYVELKQPSCLSRKELMNFYSRG